MKHGEEIIDSLDIPEVQKKSKETRESSYSSDAHWTFNAPFNLKPEKSELQSMEIEIELFEKFKELCKRIKIPPRIGMHVALKEFIEKHKVRQTKD